MLVNCMDLHADKYSLMRFNSNSRCSDLRFNSWTAASFPDIFCSYWQAVDNVKLHIRTFSLQVSILRTSHIAAEEGFRDQIGWVVDRSWVEWAVISGVTLPRQWLTLVDYSNFYWMHHSRWVYLFYFIFYALFVVIVL